MLKESEEELKTDTISINPLLYFQKPEIGSNNRSEDTFIPPIQIAFPDGGFGIGSSIINASNRNPEQVLPENDVIILSGPEATDVDVNERRSLKVAIVFLAVVNILFTATLFAYAQTVDTSLVEDATTTTPAVFQQVSQHRTSIERINFIFVIFSLCMGIVSVVLEIPLGVSAYCLAIVLNFILSTSVLPYFSYSFRYFLDLALLYFSLVFRTKIVFTFLPTHIHRQ